MDTIYHLVGISANKAMPVTWHSLTTHPGPAFLPAIAQLVAKYGPTYAIQPHI